jgi:hypothetical protein
MCLQAIAASFRSPPFGRVAEFSAQLPFATLARKHAEALRYFTGAGAGIVCVQEGRGLPEFEDIATQYASFGDADDGYTMVLVRQGMEAESFSAKVFGMLKAATDPHASAEVAKARKTTSSRVAVVRVKDGPLSITAASVHCSKHKSTMEFLVELKGILEAAAPANYYIIGCDTNVPGEDAVEFQERMRAAGFDIGISSDQVTVAKQRTMFQTQTRKCGEVDVSCKDLLLSWGPLPRVERAATTCTPDLYSDFGVERGSEKTVRLPTTAWPFDHCGVQASFAFQKRAPAVQSWKPLLERLLKAIVVLGVVGLFVYPFYLDIESQCRVTGDKYAGSWDAPDVIVETVSVCEAPAPCPDSWDRFEGAGAASCYKVMPTKTASHPGRRRSGAKPCEDAGSALAKIESAAENEFVLGVLEKTILKDEYAWPGVMGDPGVYTAFGWIAESQAFTNISESADARELDMTEMQAHGTVLISRRVECGCGAGVQFPMGPTPTGMRSS